MDAGALAALAEESGGALSEPHNVDQDPGKEADAGKDILEFREFLAKAMPLLTEECVAWLRWMDPVARVLAESKTPDILHAAGLTYLEGPYVELLRWVLSPRTDAMFAARMQEAWIRQTEWGRQFTVKQPCEPALEVPLGHGRVDLRLVYPDLDVLIEAKTGTVEHLVGETDEPQMAHYLASADDGTRRVHGILIAPTLLTPLQPDSRVASTTFALFGKLLVTEATGLSMGLTTVLLQIARHFMERAVPSTVPTTRLIELIPEILEAWESEPATLTEHLETIEACMKAIPGDRT